MKQDFPLILLSLLTFSLWYYQFSTPMVTTVYLVIFLFLWLFRRPVIEYVVVILFSVMADRTVIEIDYILLGILAIGVLIWRIRKKEIKFGRLLFVLVIFLFYATLSVSWAPVKSDALVGVFMMLEGYLLYFVLTNSEYQPHEKNKNYIAIVASIVMFTLTMEIGSIYLKNGFIDTLYNKSLLDLGWAYSNFFAVIYPLLLPVALSKYLDKRAYHPIYFIMDLLNVFGLILTQSRGAMVGAFVGIVLYLPFTLNPSFMKRYYPILLGLGMVTFYYFNPYISEIVDRFIRLEFFDDNNRFPLYELGIQKFLEKPIFGHGMKSSQYFIKTVLQRGNHYYHNYWIQIAATLGVVGLLLQGWLHYLMVKIFARKNVFIICLGLGVLSGLAHQMVDVSYDRFFFGLYMYAIIGVVELFRHFDQDDPYQLKSFAWGANH